MVHRYRALLKKSTTHSQSSTIAQLTETLLSRAIVNAIGYQFIHARYKF